MEAAASGQTDMVRALLDRGADVEAKNNLGATSLTWASQAGYPEIVKLLLDRGADVNVKTTTGITPLMVAASEGHVEVVKLLLEKGADPSVKTLKGATALDMAEADGHAEVTALLKSGGKRFAARDTQARETSIRTQEEVIRRADNQAGLTVRAEPSPRGQAIAYLPVGSKVIYHDEATNGWIKLSEPIPGGWIEERHIGSHSPEASVVGVDNPEQCLRVRSGPGAHNEKIGCLPKGVRVKLSGAARNNWAEIVFPMTGWVSARQIEGPGVPFLKPATSGEQRGQRGERRGTGYEQPQSDNDYHFERAEEEADRTIEALRQEYREDRGPSVIPPQFGAGRIGPFRFRIGP